MICSLFGHRYVSDEIKGILKAEIINLIEKHKVDKFYIGNNGEFDRLGFSILEELSLNYDFKYHTVLAYLPGKKCFEDRKPTIFPEGLRLHHTLAILIIYR